MSGLVSPNGSPLFAHHDPALHAQVLHDGSTALAGCQACAQPERAARILHDVADRLTGDVLSEVRAERLRQDEQWGEQNHPDGTGPGFVWSFTGPAEHVRDSVRATVQHDATLHRTSWRDVLLEEVAESFAEDDPAKLRAELVQVAAVAVQWVQAIDRRQT